ncbi:hypothetical protein [Micromonospora gifhornensis]|nr:hypothetical protein [Micromonospora gifhornensis]
MGALVAEGDLRWFAVVGPLLAALPEDEAILAWASGRRFESGRPDKEEALTSGNAVRASTFFYDVLNRPPKTPRLPGAAFKFVIGVHRWVWGCVLPVGVGGEALQDVGDVWDLDGFGGCSRWW